MAVQLHWQPDIFQIQIPLPENPLKSLNAYAIREGEEWLVVDTGFNRPECASALTTGLADLGVCPEHTKLFLTHLHSDHAGLAEWFADRNVPIFMGAIDYEYMKRNIDGSNWTALENRFRCEGFPEEEVKRQLSENQARIYAPKKAFPVHTVRDGDLITFGPWRFRCILTPGHTPGHVCLYLEEKGILFCGDHVLFDITPNISMWDGVEDSLGDYIEGLLRMKQLPIAIAYPAHRTLKGDVKDRIDVLVNHHMDRLSELMNVLLNRPGINAYQIASRLSWSARGLPWEQFSPNQRWFAMGETLSHIDWLRIRGYIVMDQKHSYQLTEKPFVRENRTA